MRGILQRAVANTNQQNTQHHRTDFPFYFVLPKPPTMWKISYKFDIIFWLMRLYVHQAQAAIGLIILHSFWDNALCCVSGAPSQL